MTNDTNAYMRQLEWNDTLAVATTIERVQRIFGSMAYCFDNLQNIYEYSLSILMRKDFPLSNELNKFIQQTSSNGLLSMWLKQNQFESPIEIKKKGFQQVSADTIFYLLIFHFSFSLGLLLLVNAERFIYKKVRTENSTQIWRYLEMGIDPHRYFFLRDLSY